jgi:hypothetical protein
VFERDDEALRPGVALGEAFERRPAPAGRRQLREPLLRLLDVGVEAGRQNRTQGVALR